MAIYLDRKGFSSGKMVFKDHDDEGNEKNVVITARQQRQPIEVNDEDFVKSQAPDFIFTESEWAART